MAKLEEKENFIRILRLVKDVATQAVRDKFDKYFPPFSLATVLEKEKPKLNGFLRKKWLTTAQMDLLFPKTGVTSSSSYDITLMTSLLRNLTTIPIPVMGFDVLPPMAETHDGADLARVKYYRNKMSHIENDILSTSEFTTVWNDLEQALVRLGSPNVKKMCDDIKQAVIGPDILLNVQKDISQFREEINKLQLQVEQIGLKTNALDNQMTEWTQQKQQTTAKIKECSCYDSHQEDIVEWEQQDENFVKTHVVDDILKQLQSNHCVTVTGKPGMGKSALIHHIALLLRRDQRYTIIPCTEPQEIKIHYEKDQLQVFVFDDVCGRYSVNHIDVGEWIKHEQNIDRILKKQNTKVLTSCRLQVFSEKQFQNIKLLNISSINLAGDEHSLTTQERTQIALKYLDEDVVDKCRDILEKSEFLPLLCYFCKQRSPDDVHNFLRNPFDIYINELKSMKSQLENTKWCVLFLCILHDGKIKESFFGQENDHKRQEMQTIFEHCSVNNAKSIMYVKEQLESLVGTYIKRTETIVEHDQEFNFDTFFKRLQTFAVHGFNESSDKIVYTIIHDKMFDFLCHYFGSDQQKIFIKHAKASVLGERTQLGSLNEDHDEFKVIITIDSEAEFFRRSVEVWKNGDYVSVLNYDQMKFKKFRERLIRYIKEEDPVHLRMSGHDQESALDIVCKAGYYDMFCFLLEQKSEIEIDHISLLQSACYGGNVEIVKDLINMGAHTNISTDVSLLYSRVADSYHTIDYTLPLISACKGNHLAIVTLLIDKGADINNRNDMYSPLIAACETGYLPLVTLLIDKGADINLATYLHSPLSAACKGGHLPIFTFLVEKGADINLTRGMCSPVIEACRGGHLPIVTLLIDKGTDINQTTDMSSPLAAACEYGHLPIASLLIDKGADVNLIKGNSSPLISACTGGHLQIVTLLIDKGADINKITDMSSALTSAFKGGHLSIVTLLIDKGVDVNRITNNFSPLMEACVGGHLPMVTLLIDKGVNINQTSDTYSPLISACEGGHLSIVKFLINNGADVNKTTDIYSPLISACKGGHLPLVTLLIDKGANINQKTSKYSPLIASCAGGHSQIVELLIDKGADINHTAAILSPLKAACVGCHLSIVTLLLDKGADANYTADWYTPLMAACEGGHLLIVTLLIDKGADINYTTDMYSPLTAACKVGFLQLASLLIDKGADINRTTKDYSPLTAVVWVAIYQ